MRDERAADDALGGSGALWAGVELDPAVLAIVVDGERDASPFSTIISKSLHNYTH